MSIAASFSVTKGLPNSVDFMSDRCLAARNFGRFVTTVVAAVLTLIKLNLQSLGLFLMYPRTCDRSGHLVEGQAVRYVSNLFRDGAEYQLFRQLQTVRIPGQMYADPAIDLAGMKYCSRNHALFVFTKKMCWDSAACSGLPLTSFIKTDPQFRRCHPAVI
jgi:hypothetical protein